MGGDEVALESEVTAPGAAATPFTNDLVTASDPITDVAEAQTPMAPDAPKVFYLLYADGHTQSRMNPNPCQKAAPKFVCDFAPTIGECQRQIQEYLDKWYADFNILFTLTKPTSGWFYTEVISSGGGAWCDAATNVAGVAPFLCDDLQGGVAYTFLGGKSAKETAIIIAQEQAHLVGLEHTLSTHDIMDPTICPNCDGFETVDNKIQSDHCSRASQNSYQMMLDRLGAWTGGAKPTPFGCQPDKDPPQVQILEPADKAAVPTTFLLRVAASDACKISRVTTSVAPMGLRAQSTTAPFEWTLSKIVGRQTITVTAFDPSGKQTSTSITVNAGAAAAAGGTGGAGGATASPPPAAEVDTPAAAGCACDIADRGAGDGGRPARWISLGTWLFAIALGLGARSRRRARSNELKAYAGSRPRR